MSRLPIPVAIRFYAKVQRTPTCWLWTGRRHNFGYGQLHVSGRVVTAHRVSWELHYGPIPDGLCVLHRCDNPPCVRPDHLFLGTIADDMRDKTAKGRGHNPRGSTNASARLTEADVLTIRQSPETVRTLAHRFGVSKQHIYRIKDHSKWKHI